MEIDLQPGKYVVAVSGGVDSMVLLDLLRQKSGVELVVAHYDHGIRGDASEDRKLVETMAARLGTPFVYEEGKLGSAASEATARDARYDFLRRVVATYKATAIITAHHQDDVLETVVLNLLRGTNRKGLSSLQSTQHIVRPLLGIKKTDIQTYANKHGVEWREDSTNQDETYLRNYVRRNILPRLSASQRRQLLDIVQNAGRTNQQLDAELDNLLTGADLPRQLVAGLPHTAAREVIATWLRAAGIRDFDRRTLERIAVAAKTASPGSSIDVQKGHSISISKTDLALKHVER